MQNQTMSALKKINDGLMTLIKWVLIFAGTLMTCLVIMNVILRYVFNSGLSWSEEASRFLYIWVTFLGAILANDAGLHGEHMRMDFIVDMFHGVPRKIVEIAAYLIILGLLVCLLMGGIEVTTGTWAMKTSALEIPKGAVYMIAPICFAYMSLQTLVKIYRIIVATEEELTVKSIDEQAEEAGEKEG